MMIQYKSNEDARLGDADDDNGVEKVIMNIGSIMKVESVIVEVNICSYRATDR